MAYRRCTLTKRRKASKENPRTEIVRHQEPIGVGHRAATADDTGTRGQFDQLDEPAVSWEGDVASLEKYLLAPSARRRCEKILGRILISPEYKASAVDQLRVGLSLVMGWEKDPTSFLDKRKLFRIERVLAQLEITARLIAPGTWPEYFEVVAEYRRLKNRTAAMRFGVMRSVMAQ